MMRGVYFLPSVSVRAFDEAQGNRPVHRNGGPSAPNTVHSYWRGQLAEFRKVSRTPTSVVFERFFQLSQQMLSLSLFDRARIKKGTHNLAGSEGDISHKGDDGKGGDQHGSNPTALPMPHWAQDFAKIPQSAHAAITRNPDVGANRAAGRFKDIRIRHACYGRRDDEDERHHGRSAKEHKAGPRVSSRPRKIEQATLGANPQSHTSVGLVLPPARAAPRLLPLLPPPQLALMPF